MLGGGSSEDPDDKKNDNESSDKLTEENRDVNSAMLPISETTKLRERNSKNSGITIREPIESPSVLVVPFKKRKIDTAFVPDQRFRESIVGSSSSSSSVNTLEISSQSFNGGTITTTTTSSSSSSSSIPVAVPQDRRVETEAITTSSSLSVIPSSSSLQGSIFGSSSSGSNNTRPSSLPYSVPLGSPRPSSSSSSSMMRLVQRHGGLPQHNLTSTAPRATSMQRPHGFTLFRPILPIPDGIPIAIPRYSQARTVDMSRICQIVIGNQSSSNLHGPNFRPQFQVNMTRPLSVNPHSVSRPIRSTTFSDLMGSLTSVQAQSNYQQQLHPSSSSSVGLQQAGIRPNALRQQPPLLQDVGGLDLNLPANNDDEEEDEGLDLNLPAPDE